MRYNNSPCMLPCGVPYSTGSQVEDLLLYTTYCYLHLK